MWVLGKATFQRKGGCLDASACEAGREVWISEDGVKTACLVSWRGKDKMCGRDHSKGKHTPVWEISEKEDSNIGL